MTLGACVGTSDSSYDDELRRARILRVLILARVIQERTIEGETRRRICPVNRKGPGISLGLLQIAQLRGRNCVLFPGGVEA